MIIAADSNIPYVSEFFSGIGEVRLYQGREITPDKLRDADILLVRTVTRVGKELLDGTNVRFAGTATIGCDHVDADYLASKGICFSHAAGSNSNSVSEYIIAALYSLSEEFGFALPGRVLGIIGAGNVGGKVAAKARAIGMQVLLNDPPLREKTGDASYLPVERILEESDIITVHVPLSTAGRHPTHHLCGRSFFARVREKCFFINTSRGPVVDSPELLSAIKGGTVSQAVLDVWEDEPRIDETLLNEVFIGTPHIAGYSRDGKANATRMLYESACAFLGLPKKPVSIKLPPPENPLIRISPAGTDANKIIGSAVKTAYNILGDSLKLKRMAGVPAREKAAYFDSLRDSYPARREFPSMRVIVPGRKDCELILSKLGFRAESIREEQEPCQNRK